LDLDFGTKIVPLCYPLLPERFMEKKRFYEHGFFAPTFWQDVINREDNDYQIEKKISSDLLPLPVDHRYNEKDLYAVSCFVKKCLKK